MIEFNDTVQTVINSLINIAIAVLGSRISMKIANRDRQAVAAKTILENVYSPLFAMIEPYLYREISIDECKTVVNKIDRRIHREIHLTYPELLSFVNKLKIVLSEDEKSITGKNRPCRLPNSYVSLWMEICDHIDHTYDKLCISCSYPIRSIKYRIDRSEYRSAICVFFAKVRYWAPSVISFLAILLMLTYNLSIL